MLQHNVTRAGVDLSLCVCRTMFAKGRSPLPRIIFYYVIDCVERCYECEFVIIP